MTPPGAHVFEVLDSELLLESPILAVRRDTLAMPGGTTATREIVEHFGAVAVVAERDGRIALVHQYRHSVRSRLWELPAGLLDIAGEGELSTAQRELAEEAGLRARRWDVLCDLVTSPGFCEETVRVFLARDLTEVDRGALEHEEADMAVEWIPLTEASGMILRGEIINSIAVSGILSAAEVLDGRAEPRPVDTPFPWRPTALAARRAGPDLKKMP